MKGASMLGTMRDYGRKLVTDLRQELNDRNMGLLALGIAGVLAVSQYGYGKPVPGPGNLDLCPPPTRGAAAAPAVQTTASSMQPR